MPADLITDPRRVLARRVNDALGLPEALDGLADPPDKYRLQCDPLILRGLAELIAQQLPSDTDILVGVETGGLAVAAAVSLESGLPWAVARRSRGELRIPQVVGGSVVDRRVAVVKDAGHSTRCC